METEAQDLASDGGITAVVMLGVAGDFAFPDIVPTDEIGPDAFESLKYNKNF